MERSEGKQKLLRVSGRFELPGVNYSKCMKEIQGKSILVRVCARFELARVRVIGSQLYSVNCCLQVTLG